MNREVQVRICERLRVKFPGPTRRPYLAAELNGGGDRWLQALGRSVGHARQPDATNPFGCLLCRDHDQHLALRPASSLARSRPADEDFVDFDDTLQPLTSRANHCPAQLVQQIPRRPIAPQPQHPLQAQGAGPAFLAGHVPQRFEP
jgi:hypothetical protein